MRQIRQDTLKKTIANKQVMTSQELLKVLGSRVAIKRKAEAGEIMALGSGLYASTKLDPFIASIIAVAKHYPEVVISNFTALVIHELSDEALSQVDVDIERDSSIRNKFLKVHRIPKTRLIGMTHFKFHSTNIKIYDVERTLCEAYKIDSTGALFFKALKRYAKYYKIKADVIKKYDSALGTKVLPRLQQELSDG